MFHPEADPLGAGYHIIQSKIAIGSGGFWGKGWLNGTQSQMQFLPERNTDFIFSVLAEEFGFVGICVLLGLYLMLFSRIYNCINALEQPFEQYLCAGVLLTLSYYLLTNIAMVTGLIPVVGSPLPLVSYGGTSILTCLLGLGMVNACMKGKRND